MKDLIMTLIATLRDHKAEVRDKHFIFQPDRNRYEEVLDERQVSLSRKFDTLRGLAKFLERHAQPNDCGIFISTDGIVARLNESATALNVDDCVLQFDKSGLPPKHAMDIRQFREYLEQHEDTSDEAADLRAKLKNFEGVRTTSVKIEEGEGPFQSVSYERQDGAKGRGPQLPRFITLMLRYGTREMALKIRYRLEVNVEPLSFRLVQIETSQAIDDRFIESVVDKLGGLLSKSGDPSECDWRIHEGAGPVLGSNDERESRETECHKGIGGNLN